MGKLLFGNIHDPSSHINEMGIKTVHYRLYSSISLEND